MMGCCRAGATWAKGPPGKRSGYGTNTSGRRGEKAARLVRMSGS